MPKKLDLGFPVIPFGTPLLTPFYVESERKQEKTVIEKYNVSSTEITGIVFFYICLSILQRTKSPTSAQVNKTHTIYKCNFIVTKNSVCITHT